MWLCRLPTPNSLLQLELSLQIAYDCFLLALWTSTCNTHHQSGPAQLPRVSGWKEGSVFGYCDGTNSTAHSGGNLVGLSESKAHAWILITKPAILSPPCVVRRFVSQAALSSYLTSLYPRSFIPVFNSPAATSPHSKLGLPQMGPPKGNPVFKGSRSTVLDKISLIVSCIHI